MTEQVINVHAGRAELNRVLNHIPMAVEENTALMTAVGMALLGRIKRAFVVKARGGTDEAGLSWKPLSPKTIAYSRRGGRTRSELKRAVRPSQSLTSAQQERWWAVYRQSLARYKGDKAHAARAAWFVLKAEGATTLFEKYSNRQVEILRDTNLLLNSLTPGVATSEGIFRVMRGEVIVGTNRKGAGAHHRGIPGKLPQRRLWPEPRRWPSMWWQDILDVARVVVLNIATNVIRGAE